MSNVEHLDDHMKRRAQTRDSKPPLDKEIRKLLSYRAEADSYLLEAINAKIEGDEEMVRTIGRLTRYARSEVERLEAEILAAVA